MAAAGAAPEIAVLADLLLGLVFVLSAAFLLGVLWTYRNTFGWLFQKVGGYSIHIPLFGRIRPLSILLDIDGAFVSALSSAAAKQQKRAGRFFHAAGVVQGWIVRELRNLAVEAWSWANWLQRSHLPRWVKALIYAAVPPLLLPRIVREIGRLNLPALWRRIKQVENAIPARVVRVVKVVGAAAIPGASALPGLIPKVGRLWRERGEVGRITRSLRWVAAFGGITALGLAILERLGLKWLKCRNVTSAGRGVCRLDPSLLESLLTDGLAIVGLISVVEFANELRTIEGEAVKILGMGIREWPS